MNDGARPSAALRGLAAALGAAALAGGFLPARGSRAADSGALEELRRVAARDGAAEAARTPSAPPGTAAQPVVSAAPAALIAPGAAAEENVSAAAALSEAKAAIASLATPNGFYAGNDYRQYWTRDVGYSVEVLLRLGYADAVEAHLKEILDHAKPDGETPAMVQTNAGLVRGLDPRLLVRSLRYRGPHLFDHLGEYLSNYHPEEADNPVILLTAARIFERTTGRTTFSQGHYAETLARVRALVATLVDSRGMIRGGGWLDAMSNYNGSYTLNNQAWLYRMYEEYGMAAEMGRTRAAIEAFWDPRAGYYVDRLGGDRLDGLANAVLLEEGLVPPGRAPSVLAALARLRTRYGYLNLFPAYPSGRCSQYPNQYQNSTVWPFVELRVARAFRKFGMDAAVRDIRALMAARRGLNEWYSPVDGRPGGSPRQLWSACAYVGVADLVDGAASR